MKKEYYNELKYRKDSFLDELEKTLKTMYIVPGGWNYQFVANLNDRIERHNKEVRRHNPTEKEKQELFIKIVLLGSNS